MNYAVSLRVIGSLLYVEAGFMLFPLILAMIDGSSDRRAFFWTIIVTLIIGFFLRRLKRERTKVKPKDGLLIVSLGWIAVSIIGAIPFYASGVVPSFVDALFESVSGFTTTGATVIEDVEVLPRAILLWRSFTHWVGGMGILVFTLSILPTIGVGGFQVFKAETPGPVAGKIAPRMKDTASILYKTYMVFTVSLFILLMFGGMDWFDSVIHTFGVVGTGGFSNKNASVGHFNSLYIEVIMTIYMIACGVNFSLYYTAWKRKSLDVFKDEEFRFYLTVLAIGIVLVTINLMHFSGTSLGSALRDSVFTSSSIITTSGFATANFDRWPSMSRMVFLLLMLMGSSAGSTAGGIKSIRILVMIKGVRREITKIFHRQAVTPIKVNGKIVEDDVLSGITAYLSLYALIFGVSLVVISSTGEDLTTSISTVLTTMGNVGPGLMRVGPTHTFAFYAPWVKLYISALMLLGRLELFTLVALFVPTRWEREAM